MDYSNDQTTVLDVGKYLLLSDAELEKLFGEHVAKNTSLRPISSADDCNRALDAARGFFANGSLEIIQHLEQGDYADAYVTLAEPRMLTRAFVPIGEAQREDPDLWYSMRRAVIVCLLTIAYAPTAKRPTLVSDEEADAYAQTIRGLAEWTAATDEEKAADREAARSMLEAQPSRNAVTRIIADAHQAAAIAFGLAIPDVYGLEDDGDAPSDPFRDAADDREAEAHFTPPFETDPERVIDFHHTPEGWKPDVSPMPDADSPEFS